MKLDDAELEELGKWARNEARETDDPIVKEIYKLIHRQALKAREPGAPAELTEFLNRSLRHLERTLIRKRRESIKVVK